MKKQNRMSMSKAQIKKAVALGEQVHTKFLAHATKQGTLDQVNRILDTETDRFWEFAELFGGCGAADMLVNGQQVVAWKGMTKEQLKHQVNIAFVKMANK